MASLLNNTDYLVYDLGPTDKVTGTWTQSGGVVDSAFPLTNIDDDRPWKPVKFTTNPAVILCDHVTAKRMDLISFVHGNWDGTITVKRNALDSGWGSPSMSVSVVIPAPFASGHPEQPYVDLTAVSGYNGATGYRYTRYEISNTALLSIGLIRQTAVLRQSPVNVQWGLRGRKSFPVIEHPSVGGCQLGYSLGVRPRQLVGQFLNVNDSNFDVLDTWFESTNGRHSPHLLIPTPSQNKMWWVKWGADSAYVFERGYSFLNNNELPAAWDEVGRGLKP